MPHRRGKLGKPVWCVRPTVLLDEAARALCGDEPQHLATSVPTLIEKMVRVLVDERFPGWEELEDDDG